LPEHQGRAAAQSFFRALFPLLQACGVERVELDTSPSNLAMMQIVTRLRFNPVGTTLTDRWGALVKFSKFLDEDCEGIFLRQFCAGVAYQERERRPGPPNQHERTRP
jgi:RimJ/RimL family protein N-acetyltransferase